MRRVALPSCLFLALGLALGACSKSDPEVDRLLALLKNGDPAGTKLALLGRDHADGVPAILALMAEDNRRFVQITCLKALIGMDAGADAEPAILRALQIHDVTVVDVAAFAAWKLGPDKTAGLEYLLGRARTDAAALLLLRDVPPLPDAMATDLAGSEPMRILAALGAPMRMALPRIEAALDAPTADERIAAANALYRVSDKLQPALDRLALEFRTDNYFLRQRIHIVWVDMLRAQPAAMRMELRKLAKSEHAAVAQMARSMIAD